MANYIKTLKIFCLPIILMLMLGCSGDDMTKEQKEYLTLDNKNASVVLNNPTGIKLAIDLYETRSTSVGCERVMETDHKITNKELQSIACKMIKELDKDYSYMFLVSYYFRTVANDIYNKAVEKILILDPKDKEQKQRIEDAREHAVNTIASELFVYSYLYTNVGRMSIYKGSVPTLLAAVKDGRSCGMGLTIPRYENRNIDNEIYVLTNCIINAAEKEMIIPAELLEYEPLLLTKHLTEWIPDDNLSVKGYHMKPFNQHKNMQLLIRELTAIHKYWMGELFNKINLDHKLKLKETDLAKRAEIVLNNTKGLSTTGIEALVSNKLLLKLLN